MDAETRSDERSARDGDVEAAVALARRRLRAWQGCFVLWETGRDEFHVPAGPLPPADPEPLATGARLLDGAWWDAKHPPVTGCIRVLATFADEEGPLGRIAWLRAVTSPEDAVEFLVSGGPGTWLVDLARQDVKAVPMVMSTRAIATLGDVEGEVDERTPVARCENCRGHGWIPMDPEADQRSRCATCRGMGRSFSFARGLRPNPGEPGVHLADVRSGVALEFVPVPPPGDAGGS